MTPELGPSARALLDAARDGLGPDAAAIARMRHKIDASVVTGATTSTAIAAKLGIIAVVAAIAVGAWIYSRRDDVPAAPQSELVMPVENRVVVKTVAPAPESAPPANHIEMDPVVRAEPKLPARPAVAPAKPAVAHDVAEPKPKRADLAREVQLVDQAMAALGRKDPEAALVAVRAHASETAGTGQLAEDAAAIEVEALCRLHDPGVTNKLAAFDAKWPQSAQRSRLSTSCP